MDKHLEQARTRLADILAQLRGGLLVAFSGGVDSTCLLAEAAEVLGGQGLIACLDRSPALPARDLELARGIASAIGVRLVEIEPDALDRPGYRANGQDRCFHCKSALFDRMAEVAEAEGMRHLAYGAQRDDLGDERPGHRAAEEHGVRAPLLEAGLGKIEVRALVRSRGLEVADRPAAPCLASRLPHGTEVNVERLGQVEAAESVLWLEGFSDCRVRHHGEQARIELPVAELVRLDDPDLRARVTEGVRAAGFRAVVVDLDGLRRGGADRREQPRIRDIGVTGGLIPKT